MWSEEAKKLHRMIAASSRKFIPGYEDTIYYTCECGKGIADHKFIGSTLGMSTTSVFRCADGKLSKMVI